MSLGIGRIHIFNLPMSINIHIKPQRTSVCIDQDLVGNGAGRQLPAPGGHLVPLEIDDLRIPAEELQHFSLTVTSSQTQQCAVVGPHVVEIQHR